jgi:general secretion pathway protein G
VIAMPKKQSRGFTLIELLVVMAIISVLAAIVIPQMLRAPVRAKEAVLAEDLFTLRSCIDQYYADKGHYPASLDALKQDRYFRKIPVDPFTHSADTWTVEMEEQDTANDANAAAAAAAAAQPPGIVDVHSGSTKIALDGTPYNTW